jgi:hypothetical protein
MRPPITARHAAHCPALEDEPTTLGRRQIRFGNRVGGQRRRRLLLAFEQWRVVPIGEAYQLIGMVRAVTAIDHQPAGQHRDDAGGTGELEGAAVRKRTGRHLFVAVRHGSSPDLELADHAVVAAGQVAGEFERHVLSEGPVQLLGLAGLNQDAIRMGIQHGHHLVHVHAAHLAVIHPPMS